MKKLMIAAVAVCTAALTQAATINWNSGTIYYASDEEGTTIADSAYKAKGASSGHQVTAYLFTFDTLKAYQDAMALSASTLYDTYIVKGKAAGTQGTAQTKTGGSANISVTAADGTTETPQTMYGLVIYEDKNTPETDGYDDVTAFVKTAFQTATWQDTAGKTLSDLAGTGDWTVIESVPEPFSGTLALLGMGAIALRRKMKKAKKA